MSSTKSYKQDKIQGNFDAIIIGSGLGGMATAAFLAKEGKKVLVLEKHYTPGGFTHVFTRRGYEWDVGLHYVGEVNREKTELSKMFRYVTDGNLKWAEMEPVYDKMFFGEKKYDYVSGPDEFKAQMKVYFPAPEDGIAIDKYVDLVYATQRSQRNYFTEKVLPPFLSKIFGKWLRKKALLSNVSTLEVLSTLTTNKKLIGVLTGQYGDYGLTPAHSSFMMHAMLAKHYMKGGNYPIGGASQIFETIAPVVQKAGGEIFTNAPVAEIIVKNNKATGVKMADGKEFFAPVIVSNAGIYNTYQKLLPEADRTRLKTDELFKHITPSVGHVCLYIGINESNEKLKLGTANYWIFPDNYDHDKSVADFVANPDAALPVVYISFPSSKDPDWERRFPGKTTIEIITPAPYEWFAAWSNEKWKKRGVDYDALKEKFSQRLLEALYKKHPALRGKIDFYELSTPLSTQHFANYQWGELYGIDHTPDRFNQDFLRPTTPIKNLYLTGQDIISCGIGGALFSGLLTAMAITKKYLPSRLKDL
jgi:all-trans-retinol 13,14-reductase